MILVVQNDATCPVALVGEWLIEDGLELRVVHAYAGEVVPTSIPADVDAVLPLGGTMGANDDADAPWLADERALLRACVEQGVPVLGLCLGGQLLAAANGGRVAISEVTEIGVTEVSRTLDGLADPVVGAALPISGDTVPAAQWHFDRIVEMPDAAVLLMTNAACSVQAFRLGESAYGLQMHPEVDAAIVRSWADDAGEVAERADRTPAEAARMVADRQGDLFRAWRPAVRSWGDLVWMRARTQGVLSS